MTENKFHYQNVNMLADWNGEISPLENVRISALDRGFLFGDAVYEVLRVHHGACLWLDWHLERLERSLAGVRMQANLGTIQQRINRLLKLSQREQGLLYVQVTRGLGPRKHAFPPPGTPVNMLLFLQDFDEAGYEGKRSRGTKAITILDQRWKHPDIKSINLLPNCLAIQEGLDAGCDEVLLHDEQGRLIESPNANLFCVMNRTLITAPLGQHLLHGITRKVLLESASNLQIRVEERFPLISELDSCEEIFLSSTTCEVMPVVEVNGKNIGQGVMGGISQKLLQEFRRLAELNVRRSAQAA